MWLVCLLLSCLLPSAPAHAIPAQQTFGGAALRSDSGSQHNILVTGASGYIGGTALAQLNASASFTQGADHLPTQIYGLVRDSKQAAEVEALGFKAAIFSLDDFHATMQAIVELQINIILNCADSNHLERHKAMVHGLAAASKKTGRTGHFVSAAAANTFANTSGWEDWEPISDLDDVYKEERDAEVPYRQRLMDTEITDLSDSLGVRNYIIYIPLVFGQALGFGHRLSVQIPSIVRAGLGSHVVHYMEPSNYAWPVVHVQDLSRLYLLLGQLILDRTMELPYGKKGGQFFASTGTVTWYELSTGLAQAMYEKGLVSAPTSTPWSEQEAAGAYNISDAGFVREIWGSNVNWMAERGVIMGWEPQYSREYLLQHFAEEVKITLRED